MLEVDYTFLAIKLGVMEAKGVYMGMERRLTQRIQVNIRARWQGERTRREGTVTDISTAGCFVLTEDMGVEKRELVKLELLLPGGVITLWGQVIYKADEIGFGIRFAPNIPDEERRRLEFLVKAEAVRSSMKRKQ
ncbi:MAG TPA: PilZ domain-containing protein [Pyrinomonadaceae bacterium]|nr:PilZ domain-containing protein [Pyrinomonadaceae bacterium]